MAGWKVEVTGLRQVINALQEVDKAAAKEVTKFITDAAREVGSVARGRINGRPMSNWGPWFDSKSGRNLSYEPGAVASGIRVRRSNFRRRGVSAGIGWEVVQGNAAGAIFEIVGNKSRVGESNYYWQGARFVDMITGQSSSPTPRTLYPAYYSVMKDGKAEEIRDKVLDAARKAGLT